MADSYVRYEWEIKSINFVQATAINLIELGLIYQEWGDYGIHRLSSAETNSREDVTKLVD